MAEPKVQQTEPTVIFTPIKRSIEVKINGTLGGQLGKIFKNLHPSGEDVTLTKQKDGEFVRGLVAAGVMDAHNLFKMLQESDSVKMSFAGVEED